MLTKNVCDSFSFSENCIHPQIIVSTKLLQQGDYSGLMVSFPEASDKAAKKKKKKKEWGRVNINDLCFCLALHHC